MFKKKKKGSKKRNFLFKQKKKSDVPVRIKEEDDYAVLEPLDLSKQKKLVIRKKTPLPPKIMVIKKEQPKKEIKPIEKPKEVMKTEPVKPKLIIQKIPPKSTEKTIESTEHISKLPVDHIETDIDKLMKIIDEKNIVGLDYLSKTLKINVDRLEAWAKILEDRGLIEIEYPIIGLPRLRKKGWKKKP